MALLDNAWNAHANCDCNALIYLYALFTIAFIAVNIVFAVLTEAPSITLNAAADLVTIDVKYVTIAFARVLNTLFILEAVSPAICCNAANTCAPAWTIASNAAITTFCNPNRFAADVPTNSAIWADNRFIIPAAFCVPVVK